MLEFGSIVLVPFPFTDLSRAKMRPALVVSRTDHAGDDVVVCCITSAQKQHDPCSVAIEPTKANGLKATSTIRFDKIVTLHSSIIRGKLGTVDAKTLRNCAPVFQSVFGF
jgi:mRNA interferase MazF